MVWEFTIHIIIYRLKISGMCLLFHIHQASAMASAEKSAKTSSPKARLPRELRPPESSGGRAG